MLYKRARSLVACWDDGGLAVRNFAKGRRTVPATAETVAVLNALAHWQDVDEICAQLPEVSRSAVAQLLPALVAAGMLECSTDPPDATSDALEAWSDWGLAASFFHLDTKDVAFVDRSTNAARADLRLLLEATPERYSEAEAIPLPAFRQTGSFPSVLLARRSWRRFGRRPLDLDDLSTVLGLTWGTQHWMHLREALCCPLKTSPSGGAAHSLEVYVVATRVQGIEAAVYRYAPDRHGLTRVDDRWSAEFVARALGGQTWASDAAACFFMTAVFPRVQWKYKFGRAYRAVLLEAGHFCQTFCLVSTWLRLAPFCTAALADTLIERQLRLDGVSESVLYAMGVGTRPRATRWAPWPDGAPLPRRSDPSHRRRSTRGADGGARDD